MPFMAKRKKPNLKLALKKVEDTPNNFFGNIDINIKALPCLNKPEKEKITANFDADLLEKIRAIAEKNGISYASLINDVLREVFINNKKVG